MQYSSDKKVVSLVNKCILDDNTEENQLWLCIYVLFTQIYLLRVVRTTNAFHYVLGLDLDMLLTQR